MAHSTSPISVHEATIAGGIACLAALMMYLSSSRSADREVYDDGHASSETGIGKRCIVTFTVVFIVACVGLRMLGGSSSASKPMHGGAVSHAALAPLASDSVAVAPLELEDILACMDHADPCF